MAKSVWYVYLGGESIGPVSHEAMVRLLTENRLHFSDFVWTKGHAEWLRVSDVAQFRSYLPEYPSVPVPGGKTAGAEADDAEPAAEPAPATRKVVPLRPAPKAEAAPPPAPPAQPAVAAAPAKARASAAPAAKAAPTIVVEEEPKRNGRRMWRVPIDATVQIEAHGEFTVIDISEGGLLLEATSSDIEVGTDLKLRISSPSFSKPLDMTGLLVRQEECDGKRCFGVEFTKVNPAHKRALAGYVASKLQLNE
jgi:hypothetical protein